MALRSFLVVALLVFCSPSVLGQDYQDLAFLSTAVKQHVTQELIDEYGRKEFENNIEIQVSSIDPRLKLASCENGLQFSTIKQGYNAQKFSVKVRCDRDQQWTIYIPVSTDVYADVVVAAYNLQRGEVVTEESLTTKRMNTSLLNSSFIMSAERAIGKETKRPIRAGEPIRLSGLTETNVINRGDAVTIEASLSALMVTAPGEAMSSGYVGQQIRVKNTKSSRIVDAIVAGPGRVTVMNAHLLANSSNR
ncbi:flagellar basal body P-ring formation chaperone FlgA [Teredinibacter sp. KSP-S5-2]|uniref:flagellar basal body P-ring formation chaperone FlgA n=1 Tax=Teredinibacter sp. KSP-S5-2 TaxID=3034506 RepID=UPI0029348776|nr:flagellar basal body P-ring formation chaperone FlgA [Teredinibacter sp. KSP-S5-2]WNO07986.1 flagellar basal body P-ring formation chaperone FlgA [Teredinibacter sp. KSP-S5-2]